jgi:replicative DNA helicase
MQRELLERKVLAGLLCSRELQKDWLSDRKSVRFTSDARCRIIDAVMTLLVRGDAVDAVLVGGELFPFISFDQSLWNELSQIPDLFESEQDSRSAFKAIVCNT